MPDTEPKTVLRKDMDFQRTYLGGLFMQFKEASAQGLLAEYEDLIDVMYAMFPSSKKRSTMIYDADLKEQRPVYEEWKKALELGPRLDNERVKEDTKLKVQVRARCLRKAQIVTDLAEKLKLIGEEFPDEEMTEETSDIFKEIVARAGQV